MNSASDGAIRQIHQDQNPEERVYHFVNEFFCAVARVFAAEWSGMSPRVSRLRHGAGIVAMGFVMDLLYSVDGATERHQFERGLRLLKPYTAWTNGHWILGESDSRPWNGIQNTPSDIDLLTRYLVNALKQALRKPRVVNG